jgi:hypothetical protein
MRSGVKEEENEKIKRVEKDADKEATPYPSIFISTHATATYAK